MRDLPLILFAYTALVLDSAFAESLATGPRFWLLPIAAAAMTLTGWRAVLYAAGFGLAADCLSAGPLGAGMFCASAAALAAQSLRTRDDVSAGRFAFLTGVVALAQPMLAGVMANSFGEGPAVATFQVFSVLTSAAWTTLVAWVLAHLFKTLHELLTRRREASRANARRVRGLSG